MLLNSLKHWIGSQSSALERKLQQRAITASAYMHWKSYRSNLRYFEEGEERSTQKLRNFYDIDIVVIMTLS